MEERVDRAAGVGWLQIVVLFVAASLCAWGAFWSAASRETPRQVGVRRPAGVLGGVMLEPHRSLPLPPQRVQGATADATDCARVACLALTFDDGPSPATTPQVLDVLERHHVRATFFVIGSHVPGHEDLLRRMRRDGFEIGNHSWTHPDLTTLNPVQIQQQVAMTQAAIAAAGLPAPTLFRPPYGALNAVVRNNVPLTLAMWNIDPDDWGTKDPKQVVQRVEAAAAPGRVVDMHDTSPATAAALDQLVGDLTQRYQLVTFSDLFDFAPGQPGEFFGR